MPASILKTIDAPCQPTLTLRKLKTVLPSDISSPFYPVKILSEIKNTLPGFHRVWTLEDAYDFLISLLSKLGCVKMHGTFESVLKFSCCGKRKGKKRFHGHRYITNDEVSRTFSGRHIYLVQASQSCSTTVSLCRLDFAMFVLLKFEACLLCNLCYIGSTIRCLLERFREHLKPSQPVGKHARNCNALD